MPFLLNGNRRPLFDPRFESASGGHVGDEDSL